VQNAIDFDNVFHDAIDRQVRRVNQYQFTSSSFAADPASVRKLSQSANAFVDAAIP
jgi:hypothetical protein